MKNINKKELFIKLIPLFVTLLCCVVLVSYAYYKIKLEGQKEHFVSSDLISFTYKEGEDKISITNMEPKSDTEGIKENYFEFNVASNLVKDMSINYEISILKTSTTNSFEENDVKAYLTDGNDNALVNPILISNLGNSKKIANAKVIYNNSFMYNNSNEIQTHTYRLRVWLKSDINMSKYTVKQEIDDTKTNISLTGCTFKFKVNVSTVEQNLDTSGANKPVLASNMIPVYYDEANEVWKKADANNKNSSYQWYSYESSGDKKGMWANAVTVKDTNRQTYLNAEPGTTIPMDDITTMWVWIPRFNAVTPSNYNGGTKDTPGAIDVTFVKQNEPAIDAFTFGDKELSGFWYGKFEISHTTLVSSTTFDNLGCTNETCSNANGIIIKPNVTSLGKNSISNFFFASRSMEQPNNSFGFVSTEVDTHMSKNNEWGAVAYLTQSIYGRCTSSTTCSEVYINNSSDMYTGRSGGNIGGSTPINGTYPDQTSTYNTKTYGFYTYDDYLLDYGTNTKGNKVKGKGTGASTTGTIYGVYDMSGGANEFVMGVLADSNGKPRSGKSSLDNSGFTGMLENGTTYTGIAFPDSKYYNLYTESSYIGHALTETKNWYSDYAYFVNAGYPWFLRGADRSDGASAGVFAFNGTIGDSYTYYSSRLVISNE